MTLRKHMSRPPAILIPESERAHYAAQLTLCVLAGLGLAAIGWAGLHGTFSTGGGGAAGAQGGMGSAIPSSVVTSGSSVPTGSPSISAAVPVSLPPQPLPSIQPASGTASRPNPARAISNPQVKEMVEAARAVRKLGDMPAALESLRAADLREPNHPEILSEIAMTYEAMGLGEKSEATWRSVLAMGEQEAGGYYTLAKAKMEGREALTKTTDRNPISLGACQIIPDKSVIKGQRLSLRVPIIAAPGAEIDPTQMDIHVYFFDKVGTDRIEPTRADPPTQNWVTAPVDWKDGEEMVDFVYNMPELRPDQVRDLGGKRSYYGYVVKIFYQDRLMGLQAEPSSLADFKPQSAGPASADNALFPKN